MTNHIIVGTAGHIDHGKTALVRALTGVDTDRLKEEKARGISIDLGFAHLDLPTANGARRVAFVDVPGHERFVRNMLAGVTGIDLVLFVVAADESIKPQTREHFDICRLLGLRRGIVALTKSDLVDADLLGLVRLEIEEFVAGSFLEGAPVHAVSAVTGQGIADLKAALARAAPPAKPRDLPFRLPIDRAFTIAGFGAVVTGTTVAGSVRVEHEVEIYPTGRRARVRGLQTHGAAAKEAHAGERTAVNLAGIDVDRLARGMVLAAPGKFAPARVVDAKIDLLASAPRKLDRVHFHALSFETTARVIALGDGFARLRLADPVLLLPGDRFILRRFSPVETVGGGTVIDTDPPRLKRTSTVARLTEFAAASRAEQIRLRIAEAPFGLSLAALEAKGYTAAEIAGTPLVDPARVKALRAKLAAAVQAFHVANPLLPGIPKEELRSREMPAAPPALFESLLSVDLVLEGDTVRLRSHNLQLKADEDLALAKIEEAFRAAGLAVPASGEVLAKCGVELNRAKSLLAILLRGGRLIRVSADLIYHSDAVGQLRALLAARRGQRFRVGEFKDWTQVSRKFAIPLLEYLDRERVTRRDGDSRIVL